MLRYGIPEYRLPKGWMDRELNHVWELGATFKPNMRLGRDFHLADLLDQGYDAIFVGTGCYKSNEMGIPNEYADGTVNALENLYNSTRGVPVPRLKGAEWWSSAAGSPPSTAPGHRSARARSGDHRLPPRPEGHALPGRGPRGDRGRRDSHLPGRAGPDHDRCQGRVTGVEFQKMHLGEPDEKGRRRPEPMPGTEFIVECDTVLGAIGQGPGQLGRPRAGGDPGWARGEPPGPPGGGPQHIPDRRAKDFAGGDVNLGAPRPWSEAIGDGRRASYAMDYWLRGHDLDDPQVRRIVSEPQPSFLTIVPFTDDVKEPKAVMGKKGRRSAATTSASTSTATPTTRPWARPPAACSARARRSATATCARRRSSTRPR